MIRWLKYYPLKLRQPDFEKEKFFGPRFEDSKPVWIEFEGTRIEIQAPRHRSEHNNPSPKRIARSTDQDTVFRSPPNVATDYWGYSARLARHWSYVYPWFGGGASELYFNIGVYKRRKERTFKNANFLHPKGFENAVCNILDNLFGAKTSPNSDAPLFHGPLDWTLRKDLPISAVEFWVKGSSDRYCLMFPLTEKHIGFVFFDFMSHDKQMQEKADPLVRQMLDSVKITLSPEVRARYVAIQAENPGISVSETMAPLKWPVKPEDIA